MAFSVKGVFRAFSMIASFVILFSGTAFSAGGEPGGVKGKFTFETRDGNTYVLMYVKKGIQRALVGRYEIGKIVRGEVPDEVLRALAEVSPIQIDTFRAYDAQLRCLELRKKTEPISQADWSFAGGDRAALKAFDGDPATCWDPPDRSETRIDLGNAYLVDGLRFLPCQVMGREIGKWEVYGSEDGKEYQLVAHGTEKEVFFDPTTARFIRLVLDGTIAEFYLLSNPTADAVCARARVLDGIADRTWLTEWRETNPDPEVVRWVEEELVKTDEQIRKWQEKVAELPPIEAYEPPRVPVEPTLEVVEKGSQLPSLIVQLPVQPVASPFQTSP